MFYAYVSKDRLAMFVTDDSCDTIFEDIIAHDIPRLEAADRKLAEFGFKRNMVWDDDREWVNYFATVEKIK